MSCDSGGLVCWWWCLTWPGLRASGRRDYVKICETETKVKLVSKQCRKSGFDTKQCNACLIMSVYPFPRTIRGVRPVSVLGGSVSITVCHCLVLSHTLCCRLSLALSDSPVAPNSPHSLLVVFWNLSSAPAWSDAEFIIRRRSGWVVVRLASEITFDWKQTGI